MVEILIGAIAFPAIGVGGRWWLKRRLAGARAIRIELATLEAADGESHFETEALEAEAQQLVRSVLMASAARDEDRLRRLVAPGHVAEVRREPGFLDDVQRLPYVEILDGPTLELVNVINREGEAGDRVVIRCRAQVNYPWLMTGMPVDYVLNLDEYWTLSRHHERWVVRLRERAADGARHTKAAPLANPADDPRLTDGAILELAAADAPDDMRATELVDPDLPDAHAAVLDLSLVDSRFSPVVLQAAVRELIAAWVEGIDGNDKSLRDVASPTAVQTLLFDGRGRRRTRRIVRDVRLERLRIVRFDADADPPRLWLQLGLHGTQRWTEERTMERVRERERAFETSWQLELGGPPHAPWRLVSTSRRAPRPEKRLSNGAGRALRSRHRA